MVLEQRACWTTRKEGWIQAQTRVAVVSVVPPSLMMILKYEKGTKRAISRNASRPKGAALVCGAGGAPVGH